MPATASNEVSLVYDLRAGFWIQKLIVRFCIEQKIYIMSDTGQFSFVSPSNDDSWDFDVKDFDNLSHENKLKFLTPREQGTYKQGMIPNDYYYKNLPAAIRHPLRQTQLEIQARAVEKAINVVESYHAQYTKDRIKLDKPDEESDNFDTADDDDPMEKGEYSFWDIASKENVISFMQALPKNLIFASGFYDDKIPTCFCPCNLRVSKQWLLLTDESCQRSLELVLEGRHLSCNEKRRGPKFSKFHQLSDHLVHFNDVYH